MYLVTVTLALNRTRSVAPFLEMHFRWMFGMLLKYLWMSNSSETFCAMEVDFKCTVLVLITGTANLNILFLSNSLNKLII